MVSAQAAIRARRREVLPDVVENPTELPVNHAFVDRSRTVCGLTIPAGLIQASMNPEGKLCSDCNEVQRWSVKVVAKPGEK